MRECRKLRRRQSLPEPACFRLPEPVGAQLMQTEVSRKIPRKTKWRWRSRAASRGMLCPAARLGDDERSVRGRLAKRAEENLGAVEREQSYCVRMRRVRWRLVPLAFQG